MDHKTDKKLGKQWNLLTENLPQKEGEYLVTISYPSGLGFGSKKRYTTVAIWQISEQYGNHFLKEANIAKNDDYKIIAWKNLPKPYSKVLPNL